LSGKFYQGLIASFLKRLKKQDGHFRKFRKDHERVQQVRHFLKLYADIAPLNNLEVDSQEP
jgi:hypothetical protein